MFSKLPHLSPLTPNLHSCPLMYKTCVCSLFPHSCMLTMVCKRRAPITVQLCEVYHFPVIEHSSHWFIIHSLVFSVGGGLMTVFSWFTSLKLFLKRGNSLSHTLNIDIKEQCWMFILNMFGPQTPMRCFPYCILLTAFKCSLTLVINM